jgi:hypothetical protein
VNLLLDTNVFLEVLLGQTHAKEAYNDIHNRAYHPMDRSNALGRRAKRLAQKVKKSG